MNRTALAIAALLCLPLALSPQNTIVVPNGFGTGFDLTEKSSDGYMAPVERNAYVRGFINGLYASGLLRSDVVRMRRLERCLTGMSDIQIGAILEKHARDNPEEWHRPLTQIGFSALGNACDLLSD